MITPKEKFACGLAIAGIKDEMLFAALKIQKSKEQIVANTEDEVLDSCAKDRSGNLVTP